MERAGYRFAADAIMWFHALFVLFALLGAPVVLLGPGWMAFHLVVLAWAAGINFGGCTCPLTPMENRFRAAAGESGYAGGFIQHYLEKLGLQGLSRRQLEVRAAWALLIWNAVLYLLLFAVR